mgnify:CR=1 FL=1
MHGIGEVDGRCPGVKADDLALRGEDLNLFGADLEAEAIEELPRVLGFGLPVGDVREPGHVSVVVATAGILALRASLVLPVGCDTELRALVHLVGRG